MSVFDIIFRIDEICKKYDKYDIDKQRELNAHGNDVFARLYASFEDQIHSTLQVLSCSLYKHVCSFKYKLIQRINSWLFICTSETSDL